MSQKRKSTSSSSGPAPKRAKGVPASTLVPKGPRRSAQKGVKDPTLLSMLCTETRTGEEKELHFKKLVHAKIDWDDNDQIAKINSWRNQLYGRAGLKAKTVIMWHEDEESFLELFFHLLIVEAAYNGLMIPKAKEVLDEFNDFFRDEVLKAEDGTDADPRVDRKLNAFVSKMNRVIIDLKPRLESMLLGRAGDYFIPEVNADNLAVYKSLLAAAPINGDKNNMGEVFTWEVGKELPTPTPYIDAWQVAFTTMLQKDPGSKLYDTANDPPEVDIEDEPSNDLGEAPNDTEGYSTFIDKSIFSKAAATSVDDDEDSELSDVDESILEPVAPEIGRDEIGMRALLYAVGMDLTTSSRHVAVDAANNVALTPKTAEENEVAAILVSMGTGALTSTTATVSTAATNSVFDTTDSDTSSAN